MKPFFYSLIVFSLLGFRPVLAQDPVCLPDSSYIDALAGVYPGPYHPVLFPDGGIHDTACINHPFELVLTAVIQDSITFNGLQLKLNYLEIAPNGVLNLPAGMGYACNPPNCKFESNTMGCMLISGTPEGNNPTGTYDLKLKSKIVALNGLITVNDTLPEFLIPGSHYYLVLDPENSTHCQTANVPGGPDSRLQFELLMNPVKDRLGISFDLPPATEWQLVLHDLCGRQVAVSSGSGGRDREWFDLSGHSLHSGYYLVRLVSAGGVAVRKVLILENK